MFSTLSVFEFQRKFSGGDACLQYLASMKWERGYECKRCGSICFTKGRHPFARRCAGCRYDESATAHTIFHNLKFGIAKAFYAVFRYCKKKGMSSYELAKETGISQPTAWLFHRKIQQAFASSGQNPLTGEVHVDEFVTGGPEKGKPGRSHGKKKKTLVMAEVRPGGKTGRVYLNRIEDYTKETLYPIIEAAVDKGAKIVTDMYPSYASLKETFPAAERHKSDSGKTFPIIHQQIMNFKGWLRGIHHKCSDKHYQNYLDEYCFRTNRRNTEKFIFRNLMQRVVSIKTKTFKELKANAA